MVTFREFRKKTLTILRSEDDIEPHETTLDVHAPLIGSFANRAPTPNTPPFPRWTETRDCKLTCLGEMEDTVTKHVESALFLKSPLHWQEEGHESFNTLARRISVGESQWGHTFKICGEFCFAEGYWEWLEDILSLHHQTLKKARIYDPMFASLFLYDRVPSVVRAFCNIWCPTTNTAHTPFGEVSISLWDLVSLCGLPIDGRFFDEAVPCVEELLEKSSRGTPYLPPSCKYLFAAFHCIRKTKNKVSVKDSDWISFWFKGLHKYLKPPKSIKNKYLFIFT